MHYCEGEGSKCNANDGIAGRLPLDAVGLASVVLAEDVLVVLLTDTVFN